MRERIRVFFASDHSQSVYKSIINCMKEYEYIVAESTSDYETLYAEIDEMIPDFVVSDISLNGGDGISLVSRCKQNNKLKDTRYVFVTNVMAQSIIDLAYDIGIDYYFIIGQEIRFMAKIMERIVHNNCEQKKRRLEQSNLSKEELILAFHTKLENDVTNIIREIGIPAHIKGYQYIRDGIIMAVKEPEILNYITKFLYPMIAKKYKTTTSSVERAIRHAIEVAWNRGSLMDIGCCLGYRIDFGKGKPTNSEFIALIADRFRLDYRMKGICFESYSA